MTIFSRPDRSETFDRASRSRTVTGRNARAVRRVSALPQEATLSIIAAIHPQPGITREITLGGRVNNGGRNLLSEAR